MSSRRKKHSLRKLLFTGGAISIGVLLLFYVTMKGLASNSHQKMEEMVSAGNVIISGVKTEWNLDSDSLKATLYVTNMSDITISGRLIFEFRMRANRLSQNYLETLFQGKMDEERLRIATDIESMESPYPRDRAILKFLKNGGKTTFPDYEPVEPGDKGQEPDLVFRRLGLKAYMRAGELTRSEVYQNLPRERMGELLTIADIRLVGIEFD